MSTKIHESYPPFIGMEIKVVIIIRGILAGKRGPGARFINFKKNYYNSLGFVLL
ncbi:hypothetical protein HMPREF3033_01768 [Veillonellaceae bacterium DNF00751]|nr:hypothetical protein HMPREF3033_01768 [Veillonellaceae bacterium DNF00751]